MDAYDYWKEKFKAWPKLEIYISDYLQKTATEEDLPTPGKRSPDGRFREYKYNREIARAVVEHLQLRGYDAELLVPEEEDIPLKERVRRANKRLCKLLQKKPFRPKTQTHKCLHLLLNHIS